MTDLAVGHDPHVERVVIDEITPGRVHYGGRGRVRLKVGALPDDVVAALAGLELESGCRTTAQGLVSSPGGIVVPGPTSSPTTQCLTRYLTTRTSSFRPRWSSTG